eukprot:64345-Amphidinium_carterae.1
MFVSSVNWARQEHEKRKKCGARVAYNIKPPSPSGLKDFPDCLWCKEHDHIVLPHEGYKFKIGAREDWYQWVATRSKSAPNVAVGWRMKQTSEGFKNNCACTFRASVNIYKEESLFWARGHHIEDAEEFSRVDGEQYEVYLKATRCLDGGDADDEDPMEASAEVEIEPAEEYPPEVAVYSMVGQGEEGESTYRTPGVPDSTRTSPDPPAFRVMLAKMDKQKRKKKILARTRHQYKSLEEAKPDDNSQPVDISDEHCHCQP